ncbi:MAG: pectate lyase [Bacteroidales bacterium]|nr:pectate lyase [Candidatus Liminaster caballi]
MSAQDNAPAFPTAEGFARYTTKGGRGGVVRHVTNLNDSGAGSLRDALSGSSAKIIVFDVSGYIDLKSDLNITSNTTIAGQTAPGEGITLRYYTVKFTGCDNVICRYIRFRRSQIKDINDGADATWGRNHKNIILDHCSFSWSIDEIASFYDNKDFTMQWCTLGEALANPGHSKGEHSYGGIWGGKGASFHHNFLCHMQNRVPRFNGARYEWKGGNNEEYANPIQAERVDFRNCVMYNWGSGGCYGGPGGGYINMINNYYKAGPGTSTKNRVTTCSVANKTTSKDNPAYWGYFSRYYINGNYVTAGGADAANYDWKGVAYDGGLSTINGEKYIPDTLHYYGEGVEYVKNSAGLDCVRLRLDEPIYSAEVTTHDAETAYEKVLLYCGASYTRDDVDARYMEETRTGTTTYTGEVTKRKGIVDKIAEDGTTVETQPNFPVLSNVTRPAGYDTDQDGMPDEWETLNGLNPNDASDANAYTLDTEKGWYTNVEVYLNGIVEHISKAQNADALTPVDEYYPAQQPLGIAQQNILGPSVKAIEYYTLDGKRIAEPQEGISVRRIIFANGQTEVTKVLKR